MEIARHLEMRCVTRVKEDVSIEELLRMHSDSSKLNSCVCDDDVPHVQGLLLLSIWYSYILGRG